MSLTKNRFVAYIVIPQSKDGQSLSVEQDRFALEQRLNRFISEKSDRTLLRTFTEIGDTKRSRQKWPQLQRAVGFCREQEANLIIVELKNLTNNETFGDLVLSGLFPSSGKAIPHLLCLDQPFVKKDNFQALVEHGRQQRIAHGQLIKAGLSRTNARSGNPNAIDVINKVNRPKIDHAIIYALLMLPIIHDYRKRGYSQRKMMAALNEEELRAPEGGHWVLSQLQKVLDRLKVCESAILLKKQLTEHENLKMTPLESADKFNSLGVVPPKGKQWEEKGILRLKDRNTHIEDILDFNEFLIELLPLLGDRTHEDLTVEEFTHILQSNQISVPAEML